MSPNDTTEDRLRDALAEVADSTHLSPDAWAHVEQRARRPRVPRAALALAAALGALAVTLAVVIIARNDNGPSVITADDPATACGVAAPADLQVTLVPEASAAQRDAVQQILDESPQVSEVSFQSKEEGARIFRCVFADEPERLATANLARVPPMFHVTLVEGADSGALIRRLEDAPGVSDASPGTCSTPADLEVFMIVAPTPDQIAAVEAAIEQAPGVANTRFISKEETHKEFVCVFVDQPALVEATTPEALPPSFRITVEPSADFGALRSSLEALSGVDAVADTRYPIAVPLPEFEPDDFGPPPAGHTEVAVGSTNGSPWRLSLRVEEDGRYAALAEFAEGDLAINGVDGTAGWDSRASGLSGITVGSLQPGVARVRIEGDGVASFEVDAIAAPGLEVPLFVTRLPVGQTLSLVSLDDAGNELYRVEHQVSAPTTGP